MNAALLYSVKIIDTSKFRRMGRKDETVFEFARGVNILAGPNGSGKSSLLQFISEGNSDRKSVEVRVKKGRVRLFDFEKQNPRTLDPTAGPTGMYGYGILAHMGMAGSHGQITSRLLKIITMEPTEILYLLDEPEQALDSKQIEILAGSLIALAKAGGQVVLATHYPRLILEPSFHVVELRRGYTTRIAKHALAVGQLAEARLRR